MESLASFGAVAEIAENQLRALIVEDEPGIRLLLQEMLRSRGHEVEACSDGESGWAAVQSNNPHLVFLGLQLAGIGGVKLCRKIRQSPDSEERVILAIAGSEELQALEEVLDAGADDYIPKPLDDERIHLRLVMAERRIRDIREWREVQAHLQRDALHDHLTGLANQAHLRERIEHIARRTSRDERVQYSVMILDLHGFADMNRTHGRDKGNALLKGVAGRLEEATRSIDTVARITADRFAILLDGLTDVSDPTRVATRILQSLSAPFDLDGTPIQTGANIGIALSATGYQVPEDVLRDAHSALDDAKREGPGTYRIHDPVMHAKAVARIQLESRIRRGLEEGAMELYYQPVMRLDTNRIAGFEALIRWYDGDQGWVDPEHFIPVAERSDLILAVGSWVLDHVVEQLAEWEDLLRKQDGFFVSVNVSGRQFAQADLADAIKQRREGVAVPGEWLHVEITETALMESGERVGQVLTDLRKQSIHLQIDDFGTGYSSLSYLCRFPIDTLKVDRSFVSRMQHSPENLEVVRTIVQLAHNLGMTVVAEGVETERQLEILREMGCELAQGFLFSRAVTATEAVHMLNQRDSPG